MERSLPLTTKLLVERLRVSIRVSPSSPRKQDAEILRKLPEDELEVTPKEAELLFTGKGRKLAIV